MDIIMATMEPSQLTRFNRPQVSILSENTPGCVLAQVRTGTVVQTVALANDSGIQRLQDALTMAWTLGFTDARNHPDTDQYGDMISPVALPASR
jgi:hypothetical protein